MTINRPTPTLKEIRLDPEKIIVSKTDTKGLFFMVMTIFVKFLDTKRVNLSHPLTISSPP